MSEQKKPPANRSEQGEGTRPLTRREETAWQRKLVPHNANQILGLRRLEIAEAMRDHGITDPLTPARAHAIAKAEEYPPWLVPLIGARDQRREQGEINRQVAEFAHQIEGQERLGRGWEKAHRWLCPLLGDLEKHGRISGWELHDAYDHGKRGGVEVKIGLYPFGVTFIVGTRKELLQIVRDIVSESWREMGAQEP